MQFVLLKYKAISKGVKVYLLMNAQFAWFA